MTEKCIETIDQLHAVLKRVTFAKSCVDLDWEWEVSPVFGNNHGGQVAVGWLVATSFARPDRETGAIERGRGRWELVPRGTTVSGVAKTCWLLAELIVKHELMEAFLFDGVRIFDPHHTVAELSMPHYVREGIKRSGAVDRALDRVAKAAAMLWSPGPEDQGGVPAWLWRASAKVPYSGFGEVEGVRVQRSNGIVDGFRFVRPTDDTNRYAKRERVFHPLKLLLPRLLRAHFRRLIVEAATERKDP